MNPWYVIAALILSIPVQAQVVDATLDKLASKFADGDLEWVLKKAEALMDNDKSKKDSEPYMWASVCHFELYNSEDEKLQEQYKNGLRDALKYAAKAAAKDRDGSFMAAQQDFLTSLKKEGMALAQSYATEDDLRKANHVYKQILSFEPADDNIRLAKAVIDLKMNNTTEAEQHIADALPRLEASYRDLSFKPDPVSEPLLREAMVYYIDHLAMHNQHDSARHAAFLGRIFFPLDEDIKQRAESLK